MIRPRLCPLLTTLAVAGCSTNTPPAAHAGADLEVTAGAVVQLDGTGSSDADGDSLTYAWVLSQQPEGADATLSSATAAKPTFVAAKAGTYVASLVVSDGEADSVADEVAITARASNTPPVAHAGADQLVVAAGAVVQLDGSGSSDADGDSLTFAWTLSQQPEGAQATLSDAGVAKPTFVAAKAGTYVASLVVSDGGASSLAASITVIAQAPNTPPVAHAGENQLVGRGVVVTLDGGGSTDADGDPLTYAWTFDSRPDGSVAALSDPTVVAPTFVADVDGEFVIRLVVNDGEADSAPATVTVTRGAVAPPGHVVVDFTLDDTANRTYDATDGLAWKGSFSFDATTRVLSHAPSWSGPFVPLYDDGPWTEGGHEPGGEQAGDNRWGAAVFVATDVAKTFEYGAIRGSVNGSDGTWIWQGTNGNVTVAAGATEPVVAAGLVVPAHGTIDLRLTIDVSGNGVHLHPSFQGVSYTDVRIKGAAWGWSEIVLTDDGGRGDETAGDGVFTFLFSELRGKHDGLFHSGDEAPFLFLLDQVQYAVGEGTLLGITASISSDQGWTPIDLQLVDQGVVMPVAQLP